MSKRRLKLIFPPELIREPVIYQLGKQFKIVTNILQANVEIDNGWVTLELEGDREKINLAISWLTTKGISVEAEE